MPVIVVGADTELGSRIVDALLAHAAEVRGFVSDPEVGAALKERGAKIAVGDITDATHVGGAALNTFCAVLVGEAAVDGRERAFASPGDDTIRAWASGLEEAGTNRIILVDDPALSDAFDRIGGTAQRARVATAGRTIDEVIAEVVSLEAASSIP